MSVGEELLLLPGMDGTGELFAAFAREFTHATIIRYPTHLPLSVDELVERIELDTPVTVIAESFSGAVGIRLAMKHPTLVRRLVLVGSFVAPPFGSGFLRLFGSLPFQVPPPRWALREWLVGDDASDELVTQVATAIGRVAPEVLAHRLASISRIDERASLRGLSMPVLTVSARQDRLVSSHDTAELRSCAPNGTHLELDGPHLLLQSRPREVAALIR